MSQSSALFKKKNLQNTRYAPETSLKQYYGLFNVLLIIHMSSPTSTPRDENYNLLWKQRRGLVDKLTIMLGYAKTS